MRPDPRGSLGTSGVHRGEINPRYRTRTTTSLVELWVPLSRNVPRTPPRQKKRPVLGWRRDAVTSNGGEPFCFAIRISDCTRYFCWPPSSFLKKIRRRRLLSAVFSIFWRVLRETSPRLLSSSFSPKEPKASRLGFSPAIAMTVSFDPFPLIDRCVSLLNFGLDCVRCLSVSNQVLGDRIWSALFCFFSAV